MQGSSLFVEPHVPKSAVQDDLTAKLQNGVAVRILKSPYHDSFGVQNLGPENYKAGQFTAPVWLIAHLLKDFYNSRHLPIKGKRLFYATSSSYGVKGGSLEITHQAIVIQEGNQDSLKRPKSEIYPDNEHNGLSISIPLNRFPQQTIGLEELVQEYPEAASAITLMSNYQLQELLKINRKHDGCLFIDSLAPESIGIFAISTEYGDMSIRMSHSFSGYRTKQVAISGKPLQHRERRRQNPEYFSPPETLELASTFASTIKGIGYKIEEPFYVPGTSRFRVPVVPDSQNFDMTNVAQDFQAALDGNLSSLGLQFRVKSRGQTLIITGIDGKSDSVLKAYAQVKS